MADAAPTSVASRLAARHAGHDLSFLTWLGSESRPPEAAAEEAYKAIAERLREQGAVPLQERVFGELAAADALLRGRARAVGHAGSWAVPPTFVQGAPVEGHGLAGIHVIAARGLERVVRAGDTIYGRLVELEDACLLGLADVGRNGFTAEASPEADAAAAIAGAAELLAREGFGWSDVARTWFYLRDILDWYGEFNAVRNAAFRRMGIVGPGGDGRIPASTGIEGRNRRGGWCALDLLAARPRPGGRLGLRRLHNRKQNEATEYGSAFARAIELDLGDARIVFVSGTAAIDDHGGSVHPGDFEAQVGHTLEAVEELLTGAGARLADVAQATAFVKRPDDRACFGRIVQARLAALPIVTTLADVCRPELLFEIDATAIVSEERSRR